MKIMFTIGESDLNWISFSFDILIEEELVLYTGDDLGEILFGLSVPRTNGLEWWPPATSEGLFTHSSPVFLFQVITDV